MHKRDPYLSPTAKQHFSFSEHSPIRTMSRQPSDDSLEYLRRAPKKGAKP